MENQIYGKVTLKAVAKSRLINTEKILNAPFKMPELSKEVNRIFQQVNRRLQNIEKAGVFSPAAQALLGKITPRSGGFTKLSTAGKDWNEIKLLYQKAVKFLQNPTSTASGAKDYIKYISDDLRFKKGVNQNKVIKEISETLFKKKNILDLLTEIGGSPDALKDRINEAYQEFDDVSAQLERAAFDENTILNNAAQRDIHKTFMTIEKNVINDIKQNLKDIGLI